MHHIVECAREAGYLTDHRPFVADDEIDYLPRNEVLLLCTGSQGEPRAALWRVARGDWPNVALERGDAAVFSSRIIPGNETAIFELQNALAEAGIEVITDHDHDRSEENTSELQSLMRISYAVFCLKKKKIS